MYKIFTDTDTDIMPSEAKAYGYDLISMPYTVGDTEIFPYVDFETFDSKKFYDSLRAGTLPKTSALPPVKYVQYFEPYLAQGQDILYVHFSRAMSGTFEALNLALMELGKKYPNNKVYLLDTKGITICSNIIVKEVGEMYLAGKSIAEILEWGKTEVDKFATYFFVENLSFFKRSGRVKNFASVMGNLLGIKPILNMDSDGMMKAVSKVKGHKKAVEELVNTVDRLQDNLKDHRIVIGHTDCPETVNEVAEALKAKFGNDLKIEIVPVNPTAGSHCGPDGVGVAFHAIHR